MKRLALYVVYYSIQSGGNWYLNADQWARLRAAGWETKPSMDAIRRGLTLTDAVSEWERVTGADCTEHGCPCCGHPHGFALHEEDGTLVAVCPWSTYDGNWSPPLRQVMTGTDLRKRYVFLDSSA